MCVHGGQAFLERIYLQNLDAFLAMVEDFSHSRTHADDRMLLAHRIMTLFLAPESPDYIHMVRGCGG